MFKNLEKGQRKLTSICGKQFYVLLTEYMLFNRPDSHELSTMKFAVAKITMDSPFV